MPDENCVLDNNRHAVIEVREPTALPQQKGLGQQMRNPMIARYNRNSDGVQLLPPETPV